jgi:hypothetical protein
MAGLAKHSSACLPKAVPQLLTRTLHDEFSSNYTLLTTIPKDRQTCLFSGILAVERPSRRSLFILSLSRGCDFPSMIYSSFGMKAERVDSME